jgi:NTE family protein
MIEDLKDFSLVLSGGGALGIAHLGVLHDLEKAGLVPVEIVGTSMGGIIGACMAVGMKEKDIYEAICAFASVSKWVKFSFSGNAIVDNTKIEKVFETLFGDKKMYNTDIPLKLITTDLISGKKRVFDQNDDILLKDALLATMAIPGIFTEHTIKDRVYVDGFLCANLGVEEAKSTRVLAVDVLGENAFYQNLPDNLFKTQNVLEMFEKSMRLLILNQTRMVLKHTTKEVYLLEPMTKVYKTYHFHKVDEIRALGMGLLAGKV